MKQQRKVLKSRDKGKKFKNYQGEKVSEPIANDKDPEEGSNDERWNVEDADEQSADEADFNNAGDTNIGMQEYSSTAHSNKRKFDGEYEETETKKRKEQDITLMRPPTAKEITRLRETEHLFHSNLFRLQVDEILKETKTKSSHEILLKKWIEDLKALLMNNKPSKEFVFNDTQWLTALEIELPIEKYTLSEEKCRLLKPTDVRVIGSYASGCYIGPSLKVDIAVEMPKESFVTDDEKNHRYHTKRAIYLCYVTHLIKKSTLAEEFNFVSKGNILNPILELKPSGKLAKSVHVYIHISAQADSFEMTKLVPYMSNIQRSWYFPGEADGKRVATPHYNAFVARDVMLAANEDYCKDLISLNASIRDGIILLKIWLRQRQLDTGHGGFSGFIMSMYVVYLLQAKKLNSIMSSYQVARNVWNFLAQSDWCTEGITLCPSSEVVSFPVVRYHKYYDVVFTDFTGTFNFCAEVSTETFLRVRHECGLAIALLNAAHGNSFPALFLTTKPLVLQSDQLLRITEPALTAIVKQHGTPAQQMNLSGDVNSIALPLVLAILRRGLKQRTTHINIELRPVDSWPIGTKRPNPIKSLLLGLVLNPELAFNILEMGPEANLPEAAEFREFWGELSQLRRFQDGSIAEVVVWAQPNSPINDKKLIPFKMVRHLLGTKLGVHKDDMVYLVDQFEMVLRCRTLHTLGFSYGTGENAARQAMASFDQLAKDIRMVSNIPLDISGISGSSATLRYTETFPTIPTNLKSGIVKDDSACLTLEDSLTTAPEYVEPIEGVIILGDSSRWPNDLDALRRIQAALYSELCRHLSQNRMATQAYADYFDVYKDGFVFRLRISNTRELSLMKKTVTPLGVLKYRDNPESLALARKVEHLPKLTGALHGLYLQYSAFGPGCCLAKRWLRSQLLDDSHFPDMCIELLVASLFLHPAPFEPTNQGQVVFFRFLRLLATTNWNSECLILDFNNEMTKDEMIAIEAKYGRERGSFPVLFIATNFDHTGSIWSRGSPTMQILVRVAYLAKAALEALDTTFFPSTTAVMNVSPMFIPSTDDYDLVISLNPKMSSRSHERVPLSNRPKGRKKIKEYSQKKSEKVPIVGFDPVQCYVKQLRENYGEFALFFHDPYGGLVIGVLWKPTAQAVTEFKVAQVNGRKLHDGTNLILNREAIIEDFYVIGEGLVENVALKGEQK